MGFLAPWFLVGLLAVAGPIAAHLRRLSVQRRVAFSAVEFLSPRPPQTARSRWEDVALLVARIAALALFCLAFARPYLPDAVSGVSGGSVVRRRVVLLDTSASMRREGLFGQAVEKAAGAAGGMGPADELELRTFDRTVRTVLDAEQWRQTPVGGREALVRSVLAGVQPGWGQTRIDMALREVVEEQAGRGAASPTDVVLISDFQQGASLAGLQGLEWPAHVRVQAVPVSAPAGARVALQWQPPDPENSAPEAPYKLHLQAGPEFRGESVRLRVEGVANSEITVPVVVGKPRLVTVPSVGNAAARISVAGSEDFAGFAWVSRVPQRRALVAIGGAGDPGDRGGALYFAGNAARALGDARVDVVPAATLPLERDAQVALWLLCGGWEGTERIRASVQAGATALVALESERDAAALSLLTGEAVGLGEKALEGFTVLGAIERQHALFAPFNSPQFSDFTGIRFWKGRRVELASASQARVLARFDGGDPALVEFPVGAGRVLVWASGWKPADGQWVLSSRCVPFLAACVELAGGGRSPFVVAVPGEILSVPGSVTEMRAVDGRTLPVSAGRVVIDQPGVYQMEPTGGVVVVNVAREEGRVEPVSMEALAAMGVPGVSVAPDAEVPSEAGGRPQEILAVRELEARQGGWRFVLGAVLALLVVETLWAARVTRLKGATV